MGAGFLGEARAHIGRCRKSTGFGCFAESEGDGFAWVLFLWAGLGLG